VEAAIDPSRDKARLAQMLGAADSEFMCSIVAKTSCPDADDTLLLLAWLRSRSTRGQADRPFSLRTGRFQSLSALS